MPQAGISHHITIADQAGTNVYGFMLARERGGRLAYAVEDAEQIQARILTMGELTEAEAPPQLRLYWTMEDWQGGVGGIVDRNDKRKLASSTMIDSSVRGKLRPVREFQTTTVDAAPNAYKTSGFASVGDDELWMFSERDVYAWNYGDEDWDIGSEPVATAVISRNGIRFNDYTVIPRWTDDTPVLAFRYLFKLSTDTNWTSLGNDNFTVPKYVTTAIDASNNLLLWGGNLSIDSTSALTADINDSVTTAPITDGTDFSAGDYISIDSEIMRVTSIATNDLIVVRAAFGTTATSHSNQKRVYLHRPHFIASTSTPQTVASWSSPTDVGTIDAEITALFQDDGILHVCKTDGIWKIAADGTQTNLLPRFESWKHADNFKGAFNWNGRIILPLGGGGLFELSGGVLTDISMKLFAPEQTQWHGRVAAVGGTPTTLYLLILDTANTKYHAFSGERLDIEGTVDWRWHHVGEISYTTGTTADYANIFVEAQVSGSDQHRRVWFGVTSSGSNLLGYFLPQDGDSDDTFLDSSAIKATTVKYDGNFSQIEKNVVKVVFETNNLGAAGRKWTIKYSLNGDAVKTDLADSSGNTDGVIDSTGGRETLTFPDGTTCRTLHYEMVPDSTASTSTAPEITKIRTTFQLRPDRLQLLPLTVLLSDQQRLLNGAIGGKPAAALAQLRTWDGQAAPVTVVDLEGTSRDYVFLPGNLRIIPGTQSFLRRREFLVSMVLAEV
ncbi:hypothetical protein LCGC14_0458070 [marine sediment metagenome]|uniref:Uncharacterized protein n=1 Tax=marine sediment metagenome TaxID=412755 RepID=A0A0F9SLA1_9ZZZZ